MQTIFELWNNNGGLPVDRITNEFISWESDGVSFTRYGHRCGEFILSMRKPFFKPIMVYVRAEQIVVGEGADHVFLRGNPDKAECIYSKRLPVL